MPPTPRRGLREAHAHIAATGRALSMLDLSGCAGVGDALQRLAAEASRTPTGRWVLAHGARVEAWAERRWPTRTELDHALGDHPGAIMSFDHHAVDANSRALELAGITPGTPDPANGVIVRDPRTREPTGLVLESAASLVWNTAPEPAPLERRAHVARALEHLASLGFTEAHDLLAPAWLGPLLADLHDRGELPVMTRLFVPLDELGSAVEASKSWRRDRVQLAGAKIFTDGTLNSRTAWTLTDYADPLPGLARGKPMMTPAQIEEAVRRAESFGVPVAAHAIGDGAVRATLNAIERAASRRPRIRHRVEHAELIDHNDIPRFASLGVIASLQPCHLLTDIEVLTRSLPHGLERVLPIRSLVDSGCTPGDLVLFGSDTPIVRANPRDSIDAAIHRGRPGEPTGPRIAVHERITESEAWQAFEPKS